MQSNILLAQGQPKKAAELLEEWTPHMVAVSRQCSTAGARRPRNGNRMGAEAALTQALTANPDFSDGAVLLHSSRSRVVSRNRRSLR